MLDPIWQLSFEPRTPGSHGNEVTGRDAGVGQLATCHASEVVDSLGFSKALEEDVSAATPSHAPARLWQACSDTCIETINEGHNACWRGRLIGSRAAAEV